MHKKYIIGRINILQKQKADLSNQLTQINNIREQVIAQINYVSGQTEEANLWLKQIEEQEKSVESHDLISASHH